MILFAGYSPAGAQTVSTEAELPDIYLDCPGFCNQTYIRSNVTQVNYVRDQDDADIYMRITSAVTGGGSEYTIDLRGLSSLSGQRETVTYYTPGTDTNDEERTGLIRHINAALIPFLTNTVAMESLNVTFSTPRQEEDEPVTAENDPWNLWVTDIGVSSSINGRQSDQSFNLSTIGVAERITEEWKLRFGLWNIVNRRRVELSESTLDVNLDSGVYFAEAAYSLSDHTSVGLFTRLTHSKIENIRWNIEAAPAFEFSYYPYSEFQERRILLGYRITPSYREYFNTTIFLEDSELLFQQILSAQVRYDQPWGRVDIQVSASSYLHDMAINRLVFNPSLNIRIIRGLSFTLNGRYRTINDQLSLPATDISDEEALAGARQRATSYDYLISFGLAYTFGSRFSTVVNPRF